MHCSFGKNKEGKEVTLYTLENAHIIMKVMDYGATLVSFIQKDTGLDVVEGFDSVEDYMNQDTYIGASIGRTANRIEKGIFTLNGKTYHLPINNNGNCNHGGIDGFDKKMWDGEEKEDSVIFHYLSKDGEEGYPGNLDVTVTYKLLENGISITSDGVSDADTLFAYTNHSYFNLDESDNAMHHKVRIPSDTYGLSDANGLTLDQFVPVDHTPFDFRKFTEPEARIHEDNEQLKFGNGYDHHYPVSGTGMRTMAECKGSKLQLTMQSDFPGFHFYTANWLNGKKGKKGHAYGARSAVCFEAEYCPNAINYSDVKDKPIVKAGTHLKHEIRYLLEVL